MSVTRYSLRHRLPLLYGLHLKSGGNTAASRLCPLGQPREERRQPVYWYSCSVRQERIKVSAVPTAPRIFFESLRSRPCLPQVQWTVAHNEIQQDNWRCNTASFVPHCTRECSQWNRQEKENLSRLKEKNKNISNLKNHYHLCRKYHWNLKKKKKKKKTN